ncbi:MAG: aspartate 1-decarboxylase [Candidatus Omnitrophota bacterium]
MLRLMCKSKLHRVHITNTNPDYKGSIGIDEDLLNAAGILEWEMVLVLNSQNGERFSTYCIPEPKGSGNICLYGPAAKKGKVGDILIILSTAFFNEDEVKNLQPKVICVNSENKPLGSVAA